MTTLPERRLDGTFLKSRPTSLLRMKATYPKETFYRVSNANFACMFCKKNIILSPTFVVIRNCSDHDADATFVIATVTDHRNVQLCPRGCEPTHAKRDERKRKKLNTTSYTFSHSIISFAL